MTILTTIRDLIKGCPDAETATRNLIEVLAREAIKTGDPSALVSVAAQWQEMLEGRKALPSFPSGKPVLPESSGEEVLITSVAQLRDYVLDVMCSAWLSGVTEVTSLNIQRGVDSRVRANEGWHDADLAATGSWNQPRWKSNLSNCLKHMRSLGEIHNDPQAIKTYTLSPHLRPELPPAPARIQLEPTWELVDATPVQ